MEYVKRVQQKHSKAVLRNTVKDIGRIHRIVTHKFLLSWCWGWPHVRKGTILTILVRFSWGNLPPDHGETYQIPDLSTLSAKLLHLRSPSPRYDCWEEKNDANLEVWKSLWEGSRKNEDAPACKDWKRQEVCKILSSQHPKNWKLTISQGAP